MLSEAVLAAPEHEAGVSATASTTAANAGPRRIDATSCVDTSIEPAGRRDRRRRRGDRDRRLRVHRLAVARRSWARRPQRHPLPRRPVRTPGGPSGNDREIGLQQIAAMVGQLAERLKTRPDDAEGWIMLARSYTVLTRYADALPRVSARRRAAAEERRAAGRLFGCDGRRQRRQGERRVARADRSGAGHRSDATEGTGARRHRRVRPGRLRGRGHAGGRRSADALPPDSEFHQQVVANIDEARRPAACPRRHDRRRSRRTVPGPSHRRTPLLRRPRRLPRRSHRPRAATRR